MQSDHKTRKSRPQRPSQSLTGIRRQDVSSMRERDARGRKSMEALHAALLDLVQELPLERITVDQIIAQANVGRATFYRHYATKEALVEEIATEQIDRLVELALPRLSLVDTSASSMEVARYVDEHRRLWSVLLTGGAEAVMRRRFAHLAQARAISMDAGEAHDLPVDLSIVWGVAGTVEILAWWLRQIDPISVAQIAEYLERLTVLPVLPQRQARRYSDI